MFHVLVPLFLFLLVTLRLDYVSNVEMWWGTCSYAVLLGEESDEEGQIQTLSAAFEVRLLKSNHK